MLFSRVATCCTSRDEVDLRYEDDEASGPLGVGRALEEGMGRFNFGFRKRYEELVSIPGVSRGGPGAESHPHGCGARRSRQAQRRLLTIGHESVGFALAPDDGGGMAPAAGWEHEIGV